MGSKIYNKLVNITKKKQTHRYREQTSGYQWGWGSGRYKLLGVSLATRMYCTTWGIEPIFCNNYKWSIILKNCESLYCTPVTYKIVHQLYFN